MKHKDLNILLWWQLNGCSMPMQKAATAPPIQTILYSRALSLLFLPPSHAIIVIKWTWPGSCFDGVAHLVPETLVEKLPNGKAVVWRPKKGEKGPERWDGELVDASSTGDDETDLPRKYAVLVLYTVAPLLVLCMARCLFKCSFFSRYHNQITHNSQIIMN